MASHPSKSETSGSGKRKALFLESPSHLLYRAHQLVADHFAAGADPAALTMRQFVLLSAIAIHGGASQSDLVRKTGIDRSTLAEMIARLQSRGLVDRGRTAKDGRAKSVRITGEGKKALEEARPRAERADKSLLASLSKRRRGHLLEILRAITEAAEEKNKGKVKKSGGGKAKPERPKPGPDESEHEATAPGRSPVRKPASLEKASDRPKTGKKLRKPQKRKALKGAGLAMAVDPVIATGPAGASRRRNDPPASPVRTAVAGLANALSTPPDRGTKRGSRPSSTGAAEITVPPVKATTKKPKKVKDGGGKKKKP